jgi:hypothetical protein
VRRCALLACWFAAISDSRSLRKFSTACTVRAMVESFGRLSSLRTSSCILRTEHGPAKGEATAGDLAARAAAGQPIDTDPDGTDRTTASGADRQAEMEHALT